MGLKNSSGFPLYLVSVFHIIAFHNSFSDFSAQKHWSGKDGGTLTFFAGQGNDVDLSKLLITMLRSQGFSARYVSGVIHIRYEELSRWTGIEDPYLAYDVLLETKGENQLNRLDDDTIQMIHVWAQVLLPIQEDLATSIDCTVSPDACAWVDWDPSFKQVVTTPTLGLTDAESLYALHPTVLSIDDLYQALTNETFVRPEESPLDLYEVQIQNYLAQNYPEMRVDALRAEKKILSESSLHPVVTFPYFVASRHIFDTLSAHDEVFPFTPWAKKITLQIRRFDNAGNLGDPILDQPLLSSYLSWESLSFRVRLECDGHCVVFHFQVGQQAWISQFTEQELRLGDPITFDLVVDTALHPPPRHQTILRYNQNVM